MRTPTPDPKTLGGREGQDAVLYARVSSKDQEREGYSIPAQQELLREYATRHGITITREFLDIETASNAGRQSFDDMTTFIARHKHPRPVILVEKTDRLYRNFKDYVTVDDLKTAVHLVKEGTTLSPDSKSADWFIHDIRVVMARHYTRNLSEEVRKGMTAKAQTGIWPSIAPLGYMNTLGKDGKRTIIPDPTMAPLIRKAFEEYAKGTVSVKTLARTLRARGLQTKHGHTIAISTLHKILENPVYAGRFHWRGTLYNGTYQPLITPSLYDRVQAVLRHRLGTHERKVTHTFAYTGIVACEHCRCMLVGEIKKGRYVYFHCTGQKGPCPKPYAKEELFTERFTNALKTISFPHEVIAWVEEALQDNHEEEHHEERIRRLHEDDRRSKEKLSRVLDLNLDDDTIQEKARELQEQRRAIKEEIQRLEATEPEDLTTGLTVIELASNLHNGFAKRAPAERQEILKLLIKNATWGTDGLQVEFQEPWKTLQDTRTTLVTPEQGLTGVIKKWPARPDSNR